MLLPLRFLCPVCGSEVDTVADPSQGASQRYVEDCQVCCRPLVLQVRILGDRVTATADPE